MRIVLMGPPGAGKGTQARLMTQRLGLVHLSSGDIFRDARSKGSHLGEELAKYMDKGELVPDELVVSVMTQAIAESDSSAGILLDGFPRTVPQAKALDNQLEKTQKPLDAVVLIEADEELIVQRITGRRSCPNCGKIFHVEFMPSTKGEFCDACDEGKVKLIQRKDDTEQVVRQRLAAYREQTEPVVDYYQQAGKKIIECDGSRPPEKLADELAETLQPLVRQG